MASGEKDSQSRSIFPADCCESEFLRSKSAVVFGKFAVLRIVKREHLARDDIVRHILVSAAV